MPRVTADLWQAYNEQGEPVGEGLTKAQAGAGALHGASHVWFWRRQNDILEILLQKRAAGILTWPGFMDVSTAGHIDLGETPLEAAIRETEEEVAHTINTDRLRLLFVHRQHLVAPVTNIIENEFQWVYGYEAKDEMNFLHDGEVELVKWVNVVELQDIIANRTDDEIVPHGDMYFKSLLSQLSYENN